MKFFRRKDPQPAQNLHPGYLKWREIMFNYMQDRVDPHNRQPERVYGVIMDTGLANPDGSPVEHEMVISLSAFESGESSLKTSLGSGVTGLGDIAEVAPQIGGIIQAAQKLLPSSQTVPSRETPGSGEVYVYFLTTRGVRRFTCSLKEAYAQDHPGHEVFARFSMIKGQADKLVDQANERKRSTTNPQPAAATMAWTVSGTISDGRRFVTNGHLMLDVKYINPGEPIPDRNVEAEKFERLLNWQTRFEFPFEDIRQAQGQTFYSAPTDIALNPKYVDYLRLLNTQAPLTFRASTPSEPLVIYSEGRKIGVLMPMNINR